MREVATKKYVDDKVSAAINDMTQVMQDMLAGISLRFDAVDRRLDTMDRRFDAMDAKFDSLLNSVDGLVGRIDRYESEQAARDAQFGRLVGWAKKSSKKNGIPLVGF